MSIKSLVQPNLAALITSPKTQRAKEWLWDTRRRALRRPHVCIAYLRHDDPYSLLLAQVLPELERRFAVTIEPRIIRDLQPEMYPERKRLEAWAWEDGRRLAALYGLRYPQTPTPVDDLAADALAELEASPDACQHLGPMFVRLWHGDAVPSVRDRQAARNRVAANAAMLRRSGHYLSATLRYGGQWYWGLDRLNHLETRLIEAGLARDPDERPVYVRRFEFLQHPRPTNESKTPLELFWSGRSPYAYLSLQRSFQLADHYRVPLKIRPVLPMVMRNLPVPRTKRFYILQDACREARWLEIPMGRICDPLGRGIENCYALVEHARQAGRLRAWLYTFGRMVWSRGVDAASTSGLRRIVEAAGLGWTACSALVHNTDWKQEVSDNRRELLEAGLWGVPTMRYGDTTVWGQDRFWVLEATIAREQDSSLSVSRAY